MATTPVMSWWQWKRAQKALETWVRSLIGERPYTISFQTGDGSYVNFSERLIVIDPLLPDTLGGTALLPRRWRSQNVTTLPALQWRCARALARHEAAHILLTQPSHLDRAGILHWLFNALEDGRIERYLGAMYPWVWGDFVELGRLVWQQFCLPDARQQRLLSACLLHRWDVLRPKTVNSRITWDTPTDRALWEERIRPLVEEAWDTPDPEQVVIIARTILALIGVPERATSASLGMPTNPLDTAVQGERSADDQPITPAVPGSLPEADNAPDEDEAASGGSSPPGVDLDLTAGHMFLHPYREIEHEVSGEVRRLVQQLAPPTPRAALRPHSVKGRFSTREHIRSQGERSMRYARDQARDPKGLAMVLLIDRTGSMGNCDFDERDVPGAGFVNASDRMYHARRAAMLLTLACGGANIPLCVGYAGNQVYLHHGPHAGRVLHLPRSVVWIRDWHTPFSAEGQYAAIAGMYGDAGDAERVSESLRLAKAKLKERKERTRLIVYIHDGQPTDERPAQVKASVDEARKDGTIVIGLYIGNQSDIGQLQAIFGRDGTIGVPDLPKLAERLGAILRRYYFES